MAAVCVDNPAEQAGKADGRHEDGKIQKFLQFVGWSEVGDWEVNGDVDEEPDDVFCCCCGTLGPVRYCVS